LKSLAILSPVFNEVESISPFLEELAKIKEILDKSFIVKIFLINDGSSDGTFGIDFSKYKKLGVRVVELEKNFGHQAALLCGIAVAKDSDFIIVLDSDLQDPPEYILDMVELLNLGTEIVMTQRTDRYDSGVKKIFAFLYYRYLKYFFQSNILLDSGDFWGINRSVAESIVAFKFRQHIYLRGLLPRLSSSREIVKITRKQRKLGYSKYGIKSMLQLGFSGIINSSSNILIIYLKFLISIVVLNLSLVAGAAFLAYSFGVEFLIFLKSALILSGLLVFLFGIIALISFRIFNTKLEFGRVQEVRFLS
jgi:glycosyltransferase involved in cell wall biosynthesis